MGRYFLRTAVASDADALGALHVACWRQAYAHILPEWFWGTFTERGRTEQWRSILTTCDPGRLMVVAEIGEQLVGFACSRHSEIADVSPRELNALYVLDHLHGSGVGPALLDSVVPPGPAHLWVAAENPRARSFYRKHGFTDDGHTDLHEVAPGAEIPVVRMVR